MKITYFKNILKCELNVMFPYWLIGIKLKYIIVIFFIKCN